MTTEMIRSTNKKTSRQDVLVCEEIDRATFMHQKYIWWWRQQKLSSVIHRVPAPGDANKTGFHGLPRRAVDVWGDHWQPRSAGEGPHCPISTPRVQQRGSRMVAAVATGAICSLHHWAAACVTDGDPDGSGAACVPSRPRRSTHARPRDTHGAPRGGGRRGRRRVRTIVVENTEIPPRVLIRVRHKLSETPKLCCARLIDRSCRAHANRVCVA